MNLKKIYTLVFLVLFTLVLGYTFVYLKKGYDRDIIESKNFKKDVTTLITLKQRWSKKSNNINLKNRFRKFGKDFTYSRRGNVEIFSFKNLNQKSFRRVMLLIFNSYLYIKKVVVKSDNIAISMLIEVKI